MTFIDDINAAKTQIGQSRTQINVLVDQMATVLFTALRQKSQLTWITDDILTQACTAFAITAIQQTIDPSISMTDAGHILT